MPTDIKNNRKNKLGGNNILWMYVAIFLVLAVLYYTQGEQPNYSKQVAFSDFETYLAAGGVDKITIYDNNTIDAQITDSLAQVVIHPDTLKMMNGKTPTITTKSLLSKDKLQEELDAFRSAGMFKGRIEYKEAPTSWTNWIWSFGPIVLLIAFWFLMMGRMGRGTGGIFSVGKSRAKIFDKKNSSKVTFADVAGQDEAKTEVAEIVDFLKNSKHYTELGGKIPKGALLVGPPGTGKTLLAKAVAGEADVPFFSLSGSDFVEMFVGVGASRVRDLFRQAKDKAPCIVFIDEIDAIGRARSKNPGMGSNDERESTLNQLLTEMDGFGTNSGVIILAATNRADMLDKALLRAGRFDRQIYVDLPEIADRKAIFQVHLRDIKIDGSVDLDMLARQTPGFSGADIANVCNEAALIAARRNKKAVQRQDFNDAVDRIVGGLEKRSKVMTEEERNAIAVHEAGHATVSWHLRYGDPLIKVTIVPRGKALGAAWYLPEERQLEPKQAMLDKICSLMAGRVAEEMFLDVIDTGALNDLERATKMAYAMVTYYGMSDKLPNISYYDSARQDYAFTKPYSEERARVIDTEVQAIIDNEYSRAREILSKYTEGHHALAKLLLEREVIFTEDAEKIFGPRPWTPRNEQIKKEEKEKNNENADSELPPQLPAADESTTVTPPPFTGGDE